MARPTNKNPNENDRGLNGAERDELGKTVDTETGKVIETDSKTDETPASVPGSDPSTQELVKVRAKEGTLFHEPFTGVTIDDTDDGGNEDGVIRSAMVDAALNDGRLIEA